MLDPNLIREKPDFVKEGISKKGADPKLIDKFLAIDGKRKELVKKTDLLRHERKELSQKIGTLIAKKEDATELKKKVKEIAAKIKEYEKELS